MAYTGTRGCGEGLVGCEKRPGAWVGGVLSGAAKAELRRRVFHVRIIL